MRTINEIVALVREYASHGAAQLAPLLDPVAGGTDALRKSRKSATAVLESGSATVSDPKAAAIVGWLRLHPKPHWAIGKIQDAYQSPRWS